MSGNVNWISGVDTSGNTITNDGSSYQIGDNILLTAAHVVLEFNEVNSVGSRAILQRIGLTILDDPRGYQGAYLSAAQNLSNPLPSGSPGDVSRTVEATLFPKDLIVVAGGGSVNSSNDGLATFLDPADMAAGATNALSGATFYRDAKVTGLQSGTISNVSSGSFEFSATSNYGDSGGGYLVRYDGHDYVFGVQSAQHAVGGVPTGTAIANFLSYQEWTDINQTIASAQSGDITTTDPHNLVVGSNSADTIDGSSRGDFLLGRGGADVIRDGDTATSTVWADDTLVGGNGDDALSGGKGNDQFWGNDNGSDGTTLGEHDRVDYSAGSKPVVVNLNGSGLGLVITVQDGTGSTDSLHAIEEIVGTSGRDIVNLVGDISAGTSLLIDANGGQSPAPADTINLKAAASSVALHLQTNGTGYMRSAATNGQIDLAGFHTTVVGSEYGDDVDDQSSGAKQIDGRSGNDTISIGDDGSQLFGGEGDDTLTGGDGDDVIVGGFGTNLVEGGGGSDLLIASGYGSTLRGGDGNDLLRVVHTDGGLILNGGAGDDVLDARSGDAHVIAFAEGDGHDTVLTFDDDYDSDPINYLSTHGVSDHWGVSGFDMSTIASTDVTIVWNPQVLSSTPGISGSAFLAGDMAVVINSTGDSIFLGNVYGNQSFYGTDDYPIVNSPNTAIFAPGITFSDGTKALQELAQSFQDPSGYNVAESGYTGPGLEMDEAVVGTSGDDDLRATGASASITAGAGDDVIHASTGQVTVNGGDGNDELSLLGSLDDFNLSQIDGDLVLTSRDGAEGILRLKQVESIYSIADGQHYAAADVLAPLLPLTINGTSGDDYLQGGPNDDEIHGGTGNDTFAGGLGNDSLWGDDGADTFLWNFGDGNQMLVASGTDSSVDDVVLSSWITPALTQVGLTPDGNGIVLSFLYWSGSVTLADELILDGGQNARQIIFGDSTVWTHSDLMAMVS